MKRLLLLTLISATLITFCTGCANRYVLRLTNGSEITTLNRPKLDKQKKVYRYKNADGKEAFMPAIRVSEIEPQ